MIIYDGINEITSGTHDLVENIVLHNESCDCGELPWRVALAIDQHLPLDSVGAILADSRSE